MNDVGGLDVFSDKCFGDFLKLIYELTGITIATNRKSMVQGRLRKRVTTLMLPSYEAYFGVVRSDKAEQVVFVDLVTTNETYFYRTPRIWDYIEKQLLPSWLKSHPKQVFLAWSSAASSGEEAHTLGIVCQAFKEKNPEFLYQIIGSDISQEMVSMCQAGEYSGRSIESFKTTKPDLFQKYMKAKGDGSFHVVPEIKSRLRFQQQNLFKPIQVKDRFDLVLCRNVLIYFTSTDQEKVLNNILPRMIDDGVLIIGESESLSHIQTGFKHIEPLIYSIKPKGEANSNEAA